MPHPKSLTYEEWREYQRKWFKTPRGRYHQHKGKAGARGIPFLLTFEQWWNIWQASGKWEQRGNRRSEHYVMARFGDQGAYEVGNVRICTIRENAAESNLNNYEPTAKRSAVMKAWWSTVTPEQREAIVQARIAALPAHSRKTRRMMSQNALGRRMVMRDGRRCWAHLGDEDYPG